MVVLVRFMGSRALLATIRILTLYWILHLSPTPNDYARMYEVVSLVDVTPSGRWLHIISLIAAVLSQT